MEAVSGRRCGSTHGIVSEVCKGVDALQMLTAITTTQSITCLKEVGSRNAGTSAHQSKHARVPEGNSQTYQTK